MPHALGMVNLGSNQTEAKLSAYRTLLAQAAQQATEIASLHPDETRIRRALTRAARNGLQPRVELLPLHDPAVYVAFQAQWLPELRETKIGQDEDNIRLQSGLQILPPTNIQLQGGAYNFRGHKGNIDKPELFGVAVMYDGILCGIGYGDTSNKEIGEPYVSVYGIAGAPFTTPLTGAVAPLIHLAASCYARLRGELEGIEVEEVYYMNVCTDSGRRAMINGGFNPEVRTMLYGGKKIPKTVCVGPVTELADFADLRIPPRPPRKQPVIQRGAGDAPPSAG